MEKSLEWFTVRDQANTCLLKMRCLGRQRGRCRFFFGVVCGRLDNIFSHKSFLKVRDPEYLSACALIANGVSSAIDKLGDCTTRAAIAAVLLSQLHEPLDLYTTLKDKGCQGEVAKLRKFIERCTHVNPRATPRTISPVKLCGECFYCGCLPLPSSFS